MPFSLFFGLSSSTQASVGLDVDQLMTRGGSLLDRDQVPTDFRAIEPDALINTVEKSAEISSDTPRIQVLFDPDQLFSLKGAAKA